MLWALLVKPYWKGQDCACKPKSCKTPQIPNSALGLGAVYPAWMSTATEETANVVIQGVGDRKYVWLKGVPSPSENGDDGLC